MLHSLRSYGGREGRNVSYTGGARVCGCVPGRGIGVVITQFLYLHIEAYCTHLPFLVSFIFHHSLKM